jgi:predicted MFS family arabinose efflux permease
VVWIRIAGVAMLVAMALMGTFVWASIFYFVRSLMNRGSVGARQAVSQSLTRDERRGVAASYNMASMRVPASVGPTVAGYLMEDGNLTLPFFLGAGLQLSYAILYGRAFSHLDKTLVVARGAAEADPHTSAM